MSLNYLEIVGTLLGLGYLFFEIKQNRIMWLLGMVMSAIYAVVFGREGLYASMGVQIYNFIISIYGFIRWNRDKNGSKEIFIRKLNVSTILLSIGFAVVVYILFAFVLSKYTPDPQPHLDAIVTAMTVVGNVWLSRSYREQWLIWMGCNALMIYLSCVQGLYFTAGLYFFYLVASFYGWWKWKRK